MDVQGSDNLDGMFAEMAEAEDAANARLTPGQVRLRDAVDETVYFANAKPEYDLVIYGVVPPNAETQKGADFNVNENRARGYLTGIAYSSAVGEDGEPGDTHVSEVIQITEETFEAAKSLGFPDWSQLLHPQNMETVSLGRYLARHERETLGRP
jgi:hypothetical protein